ncbi:hypothetical protein GLYMA_10G135332v4 [Glycine max]|nr:hypothetical protein GLYMA_10G135332v4 [Glycine max]KAH1138080.1 hypothetical protein GYH30_027904 [Glycine max]
MKWLEAILRFYWNSCSLRLVLYLVSSNKIKQSI